MIYAPVVIPTLNRYEHLKQCLESLSRCTWADKTEVYVALDYPPADKWDKYAPGWEKNRDWLRSVGDMGFKKLHLIERTENYGVWTSKLSNAAALEQEVAKEHKYYIFTEDDNVFSPCFLEYMDKGIEKFKDDESVMALCGYSYPFPIKCDENSFYRHSVDFSGWGCLMFKEHYPQLVNYKDMRKFFSLRTCWNMYRKYGARRLALYLRLCDKSADDITLIDNNISILGSLLEKDFIMPTESLVRNIGADGTGINWGTVDEDPVSAMLLRQKISEATTFEFDGKGDEYYEENRQILVSNYWKHSTNGQLMKVMIKSLAKRVIRG